MEKEDFRGATTPRKYQKERIATSKNMKNISLVNVIVISFKELPFYIRQNTHIEDANSITK